MNKIETAHGETDLSNHLVSRSEGYFGYDLGN